MKTCEYCKKLFKPWRSTASVCSRVCADRKRSRPLEERFWSKVIKSHSCWRWIGSTQSFGYGQISDGNRNNPPKAAHRVSWELHFGPIPEGMHICHTCDNPPCTNPKHLFLGTMQDNMQDKVNKRRQGTFKKLTTEQVIEIRGLYQKGNITQHELGIKFNVSRSCILDIIRRRNWKNI